jgi:hypothetical protein
MPYLPKKTWLEMAPRIPGLSRPESQYGMGQDDSDLDQVQSLPVELPASSPVTQAVNDLIPLSGTSSSSNLALWVVIGGAALLLVAVAAGGKR